MTVTKRPLILSVLALLAFMLTAADVAFASGSAPTPSPRSRQQSEADRLYQQGRRVFSKKVSCRKECILPRKTINKDNAHEYLVKINEETQFTDVLSNDEIRAVSFYLVRRYKIRV